VRLSRFVSLVALLAVPVLGASTAQAADCPGDPDCGGHGTCDTDSGKCACAAGWSGDDCSVTCPVGHYCPAGNDGTPLACPAGRYGDEPGLSSINCSGSCTPGYYCPAGSTSATQHVCPVGHFCPSTSGAPTQCEAGKYGSTTGLTTAACSGNCTAGYY